KHGQRRDDPRPETENGRVNSTTKPPQKRGDYPSSSTRFQTEVTKRLMLVTCVLETSKIWASECICLGEIERILTKRSNLYLQNFHLTHALKAFATRKQASCLNLHCLLINAVKAGISVENTSNTVKLRTKYDVDHSFNTCTFGHFHRPTSWSRSCCSLIPKGRGGRPKRQDWPKCKDRYKLY
ncbi:hypothetical protein SAMN05444149_1091, partial [Pseudosulfitobacter pseudonitzschiae]